MSEIQQVHAPQILDIRSVTGDVDVVGRRVGSDDDD
jgi:hypothetical protein